MKLLNQGMVTRRCRVRWSANICIPRFDYIDRDLYCVKWTLAHGYARGYVVYQRDDGEIVHRRMLAHRVVLERALGRPLTISEICDHINFKTIDNRRSNLRITNIIGNAQHRCGRGASKYRGVSWVSRSQRWQAGVGHMGKYFYCGTFVNEACAARAAATKRKELGFLGE